MASPGILERYPRSKSNSFYPVVVSGFGPRDWNDLATCCKGYTRAAVDPGRLAVPFRLSQSEC